MVLDNLKAAIIKAYTVDDDPEVQQSYRECAEHYGFLIDPCLPRKPQHKGKVERGGVGYLKQSFVPWLAEDDTLTTANQKLRQWLMTTAGLRVHGTTREVPLARFEHIERAALLPLPALLTTWPSGSNATFIATGISTLRNRITRRPIDCSAIPCGYGPDCAKSACFPRNLNYSLRTPARRNPASASPRPIICRQTKPEP